MPATTTTQQDEAQRFTLRARELAPAIRGRIAETEALRTLPPASVAELLDAGFAEANDIQHHWRDVHVASTHISMNDSAPIHWARTELGLGPAPKQAQY